VVAWLAGAAIVVPPWLAGAWEEWAQWVTLALAGLAVMALFGPVFDYRVWPPSPPPVVVWRRLRVFPVFWLGLAILIYGAVAANNRWLALTSNGREVWLEVLPHVPWLPRSIESPFWDMNAWRALLVITPAWLVACAVWAGIETEGSLYRLMRAVAANGALLAGLGLAERASGTRLMFWFFDPRPDNAEPVFFGSFIYAWHAAAWLLVACGAAFGCMLHSTADKSRGVFFWVAALGLMIAALMILSFAWYLGLALGLTMMALCVSQYARCPKQWRLLWVPYGLLGCVALIRWFGAFWTLGGEEVDPQHASLAVRYELARTSATMIPDEPLLGWGPGSYSHISSYYLKQNPLFTEPGQPAVLRYRANYAHSDWVQYAMEWGVLGAGLFAAVLCWWAAKVWQYRRALPPAAWCALAAVAMVILGASLDFPFYNPAVLLVITGMLATAVKLGEVTGRSRPAMA
jgi:hypothetical protein